MKQKSEATPGMQELCRKLKIQLDELAITFVDTKRAQEDDGRRTKLMEQLKKQLAELSR